MKTMLRNLLAVLAIVGWASAASAAGLFTETFSYPNGDLTSVSGGLWTRYSTDYYSPVRVFNESITLNHACSHGSCQGPLQYEDLQRAFPAAAAGQTIYAGFDVNVAAWGHFSTPTVYFAHFLAGTAQVNRLFGTTFSGSDFTLGIGNGNSPAVRWASALTGTTHRVVLSYQFDSGIARLWIDPANQTSASISFTDVVSSPISAFGVSQNVSPPFSSTWQKLDNLVVGTRFRDVLAIPTPPLAGDYDGSGTVGPEDYDFWRANFGFSNLDADGSGNGIVDGADYVVWRKNFGASLGSGASAVSIGSSVPEPACLSLVAVSLAAIDLLTRRQRPGSRQKRCHY